MRIHFSSNRLAGIICNAAMARKRSALQNDAHNYCGVVSVLGPATYSFLCFNIRKQVGNRIM